MAHINKTVNKRVIGFTAALINGLIQTHRREQQFGLSNCNQRERKAVPEHFIVILLLLVFYARTTYETPVLFPPGFKICRKQSDHKWTALRRGGKALRTHFRWDHSDRVQRWSEPRVATFF